MCDEVDCRPELYNERYVVARKQHKCCACSEPILPKQKYRYTAGKWEGEFDSFKHCNRCAEVFDILQSETGESIDVYLDCGEVYEGKDQRMYELAFATPEEMQK